MGIDVIVVAAQLSRVVLLALSPKLLALVKGTLLRLLFAAVIGVSALGTGVGLYVLVISYAPSGASGSVALWVRLTALLLVLVAALLLFILSRRSRLLYGLIEFGVAVAIALDAVGASLSHANLSTAAMLLSATYVFVQACENVVNGAVALFGTFETEVNALSIQ